MMLTRCPDCNTAFRVSAEQLKAKQGKVRCGQCRCVFNALETLVDEADAMTPAPAPAEGQAVAEATAATAIDAAEDARAAAVPEETLALATPAEEETAAAADAALPPEDAAPDEAASDWSGGEDGAYTDSLSAPVYKTPTRAWLWGPAAALALLFLLTQATLQFRSDLALALPGAKPLLADICSLFGYDLPLPQRASQLAIETSDLHPRPGNEAQLILAATLKNRAPFAQAYPYLELTLTDSADQALARRVIAPAEYLPASIDRALGFAANGDLAFNLALETDLSAAAGYRIYVFYP